MNSTMETKIRTVITDCKNYAAQWQDQMVLKNTPNNKVQDVYDERAKQVNLTNVLNGKKKDLQYLIFLLMEAKMGISGNTPSGSKALAVIDNYINLIKSLLQVYKTIEDSQYWVLNYYDKGGGLQF